MPVYTYRREDGTTFDIRQKFLDDPLEVDPKTGQKVYRVIHASGIIFKGSGFYVTDNKGATPPPSSANGAGGNGDSVKNTSTESSSATKTESKAASTSASD